MIQNLPKVIKRIDTGRLNYPIIVEYPITYEFNKNDECTIHYTSNVWKETLELVIAKDYDTAEMEMKKILSNKFQYKMGEGNVMWAKKIW